MSSAHFRPLSFGEVLDGAFTLYRRHFSTLALTSLIAQLPVLAIYLLRAVLARPGMDETASNVILLVATAPAALVGVSLGRPALVRQVSNAYLGQEVSRADGFAIARKRFWPFLLTTLLAWFAIGLGWMFFFVPGILMSLMFFATDQVVTLEGARDSAALSRSAALARGAWLRIMGLNFVLYLIVYMPMIALGVGGALFLPAMAHGLGTAQPATGVALMQVGASMLTAVALPLVVAGTTLQYYDRRVRTEALDLAMPARDVAHEAGAPAPA